MLQADVLTDENVTGTLEEMKKLYVSFYVPRSGKEQLLLNQLERKESRLRELGLVTETPAVIGKVGEGTVVKALEFADETRFVNATKDKQLVTIQKQIAKVAHVIEVGDAREIVKVSKGLYASGKIFPPTGGIKKLGSGKIFPSSGGGGSKKVPGK